MFGYRFRTALVVVLNLSLAVIVLSLAGFFISGRTAGTSEEVLASAANRTILAALAGYSFVCFCITLSGLGVIEAIHDTFQGQLRMMERRKAD